MAERRKTQGPCKDPAGAVALMGSSAPSEPAAGALDAEDELQARCARVAQRYRLTRRESEVLPYLAKGRSAKVIADALFVSENTVRSHISRILDKTDLHSKQQLIDRVDSFA